MGKTGSVSFVQGLGGGAAVSRAAVYKHGTETAHSGQGAGSQALGRAVLSSMGVTAIFSCRESNLLLQTF